MHTFVGLDNAVVERELQAAEAALSSAEMHGRADDLAGRIAGLRAMQAIPHQRADIALTESRRALELLRGDNLSLRTAATWTLGFAHQVLGDRAPATEAFSQAVATGKAAGNVMFTIAAATSLGQTLESQNDAHAAESSYRQAVELAGEPPLPASCEAQLGLARLKYEWNDITAATIHAQLSLELAELMPSTPTPASCGLLLARTQRARGDLQSATETLQEAERFARENGFAFHLRQVADEQVRTLLQGGRVAEAADLADEHALEAAGARVHLAQGAPAEAVAVLQPLHERALERSWHDELLKIGVLLALAHRATGDSDEALRSLREALDLAEPAGYVRIFVDEGEAMAMLLTELQAAAGSQVRGSRAAQLVSLSAAFAAGERAAASRQEKQAQQAEPQPLDEPLTERELEVLRLIADGLSNAAIGKRLFRAVATVKGHNRMIFAKLAVRSRTEAIARARELGLL